MCIRDSHRDFLEETPRLGLWLDSSGQTPEQTVEQIVADTDRALTCA